MSRAPGDHIVPSSRLRAFVALLAALPAPALLGAQSTVLDPGTLYVGTPPVTSSATGSSMAGLQVTAFLQGGGSITGSFADLGGGFFGVSSGGFGLRVGSGTDTFS